MPTPHHSVFLQAGCPFCRPTNSVKALKSLGAYGFMTALTLEKKDGADRRNVSAMDAATIISKMIRTFV